MHGFWSVEDLAQLGDEPTGFGELSRGGCLVVTRSSVVTEAERRH